MSLLIGVACGQADLASPDEAGLAEDVGLQQSPVTKGSPGAVPGSSNYCSDPAFLCLAGEGDCDGDRECQAGLVCGRSIGKQFAQGRGDACVPAHCVDRKQNEDETQIDCGGSCGTRCAPPNCDLPLGSPVRCTTDCRCQAGEGECYTDEQCVASLVCGRMKGLQFGFNGNACVAAHCVDRLWNEDETGTDCGGSCGSCKDGRKCVADEECPGGQSCAGAPGPKLCVAPTPHCSSDAECALGTFCEAGACRAAASVGQPCSPGGRCDATGYCNAGTCAEALGHYDDCSDEPGQPPCAAGLRCRQTLFGPPQCLAPGDSSRCEQQSDCSAYDFCGAEEDRDVIIQVCKPFRGLGQHDCNNRLGPLALEEFHCGPGLYCKDDPEDPISNGVCVRSPGYGERCATGINGSYAPCGPDLYCNSRGVCAQGVRLHHDCSAQPCAQGLVCANGVVAGVCSSPGQGGGGAGGSAGGGTGGGGAGGASGAGAGGAGGSGGGSACACPYGSVPGFSDTTCKLPSAATATGPYYQNSFPGLAVDGIPSTTWNGGDYSATLSITLPASTAMSKLLLLPNYWPLSSAVSYTVTVVDQNSTPRTFAATFTGPSASPLELPFGSRLLVKEIRVLAQSSSTWIGLFEVMYENCGGDDGEGGPYADDEYSQFALGQNVCAIRPDGTVRCWGAGARGATTSRSNHFLALDDADSTTCGLRDDFTVECWGEGNWTPPSGTFNAIGLGRSGYFCGIRPDSTLECSGPNSQGTAPLGSFSAVSIGDRHSCAIRSNGTLACWGSNELGQLEPRLPPSTTYRAVAAGAGYTCAIRSSGELVCWGDNSYGRATPPSGTFVAVATDEFHACAIGSDATVACWGANYSGQLNAPSGQFRSVQVGLGTSCAVRVDGHATCWGSDYQGRRTLPGGTFTSIVSHYEHACRLHLDGTLSCWGITEAGLTLDPPAGTFSSISTGHSNACGIRPDGALGCWGENVSGESSPPSGTFSSVTNADHFSCGLRPQGTLECWGDTSEGSPPSGTFMAVEAGGSNACALRLDGTVACWGNNDWGQSAPPAGAFKAVAGGEHHFCGIRPDGSVECWGIDYFGETAPQAGPFASITCGETHTCGIRPDGTVRCWGSLPEAVPSGTFSVIDAGMSHTCGIRTDGTEACWGSIAR